MPRLQGKVALITGAAVGMGAAHARLFVSEGAQVVISDINAIDGEKLAEELGSNAIYLKHDVTDPQSWESVLDQAQAAFGPVTVLVNNAGLPGPNVTTTDLEDADYHSTVAVDEHGVFYGMRAALPRMIAAGGGSIVNISSVAGFAHVPGTPNVAYTAAKFAVRGMTKATAVEYASQGVRVNSIHPGGVITPMLAAALDEATQAAIAVSVPIGRLADPGEISYAALFLASDESSYVTGTELVVDGGMLAH
ncbi:glucose 1-dehydrogenase [Rhodococcus sp. NPDC057014]|uniref:glucose 1-dehydrogenase n=1 Tax=Rhodococcus sp. NPDC057014 TaxID=3346000 RepID=UPI00363C1A7E